MNLAAGMSIAAGALNLFVAALFYRMSKAHGWGLMRRYMWISLSAGLYNVFDIFYTLPGYSAEFYNHLGRCNYMAGTLNCVLWIVYAYSDENGDYRQQMPRIVRWLCLFFLTFGMGFSLLGLGIREGIRELTIGWANVTYRYPLTNPWGDVYGLLAVSLPLVGFARLWWRWRQGERVLGYQLLAFGVFMVCALEEVLVANGMLEFLSLADLGYLILVLPLTLETLARMLRDEQRLYELSGRLQAQVESRTRERDSAQTALAEAEAGLGELVSTLEAIVWEADAADLWLTFVSDGTLPLLGYTSEEFLGEARAMRLHVVEEDRERVLAFWAAVRDGGMVDSAEYRLRAADGREVWFRDVVRPVRNDDGAVVRLRGVMVDMTESRRALAALEESEERFRTLFEAGNDAVLLLENELIRQVNRRAVELFGREEEELLGQHPAVLSPELQPDGAASVESTAELFHKAQRAPQRFRWVHTRKDGAEFTVDIALAPVVARGRTYQLALLRDVTEQLRLEEELRQGQKMEAVGRLAGGIAHDFNNLLTVINGYAEMLLLKMEQSDRRRGALEEMKKAGDKASSLTQQLLAFSRKQLVQPKVIDLNAETREAESILRRLIGEDIVLEVELEEGLPRVRADVGQLHQVLMNLAINARDAMQGGGRLTLRTARREGGVRLTVRDTGCGMAAEVLAHIFEPFFTTKGAAKGTGLGLSTVYGIVRQSEWTISVESEVGRGSSFHIEMPAVEEENEGGAAPGRGSGMPLEGVRVLVVEDQHEVRAFAVMVLRAEGVEVLEAPDGEEALRVAGGAGALDLLLTDLVMPGMSGRELGEQLCAARPGLKVIYTSGYTDDVVVRQGLSHADLNYLAKPFTPLALVEKVREALA